MRMEWVEKVRRLKGQRSLADIERAAGWGRNSLASRMSRRVVPGVNLGISLARALDVSVYWLFDAGDGWPPPSAGVVNSERLDPAVQDELLRLAEEIRARRAAATPGGSTGPGPATDERTGGR